MNNKKRVFSGVSLFLLLVIVSSCGKKFLETDVEKIAKEDAASIEAYAQNNNLTLQKSDFGVSYVVTEKNPAGATIQKGDQVVVYYKITLLNGALVDSVQNRPPFKYNSVLNPGFDGFVESVRLLKVGEKGTFLIPSILAYGGQTNDKIPANSVLRLDLELVDFRNEEKQIDVYIADKKFLDVEKSPSGLRYIKTTPSTGSALAEGDEIVVKYTGKFLSDVRFDSGEFTLKIGSNSVIKGFEEGIKKMRVGEKATIVFPSGIGYGEQGTNGIPPFTPLTFELEVTSKR